MSATQKAAPFASPLTTLWTVTVKAALHPAPSAIAPPNAPLVLPILGPLWWMPNANLARITAPPARIRALAKPANQDSCCRMENVWLVLITVRNVPIQVHAPSAWMASH